MELFGRRWALQVGGLDLTDIDLSFKVARGVHREPAPAEINVWNLRRETRALLEADQTVILRAGYKDPPVIFRGDLRRVWTERDGATDLVTKIQARDGGQAYAENRISKAYGAGTPVFTVLRDAVDAMGIGEGNLRDFGALVLRNGASSFGDGYVAAGPAHRIVNDLIRGAGLRWSIQGGNLQIMLRGQPLQSRSVVLSSATGLVESPAWDETGRRTEGRRGVCTAKVLIQPGIEPGKRVRLESEFVTGDFEVRKVTYTGDTRANDWYGTLELRSAG